MLSSFEITNFRTFSHIALPELGQINLIVGRNNTGKTMLLEALRLHKARGAPFIIRELLSDRDEYEKIAWSRRRGMRTTRLHALYHGRNPVFNDEIVLGPCASEEEKLSIRAVRLHRVLADDRSEGGEWIVKKAEASPQVDSELRATGLVVRYGSCPERIVSPEPAADRVLFPPFLFEREVVQEEDTAFVPATGLPPRLASSWWDSVSLTDAEERIVKCLKIIAPIQRLNFVESPNEGGRYAVCRLDGESDPVPLRALGDGMTKMFNFALAMEAARGKSLLLIDEIENGIHYTAHSALWRFLIETARTHNVQVFATTHSWDCVEGLQEALAGADDMNAMLLRLYRRQEKIDVVAMGNRDIAIAARDRIEVR